MELMVFDFDSNGSVEGLHHEQFPLGFLGEMDVQRASEIMFNKNTQSWDVILPNDQAPVDESASGFSSYDVAREFEAKWLTVCRIEDYNPRSVAGIKVARDLRVPIDIGPNVD